MAWSHFFCDTRTGQVLLPVEPVEGRWQSLMNGVGTGSHTFLPGSSQLDRSTWRDLVRPWARTLVVCWDDVPVYAGLVSDYRWERDTGRLTVRHQELRAIFSKRYPFQIPTFNPAWAFEAKNKSLRGLARAVVRAGTYLSPGANWNLPVALPPDEAGAESRTWWYHTFPKIEDMLAEVQDTDGGPDIVLQPRWASSTALEWALVLGWPRIAGHRYEIPAQAAKASVTSVTEVVDGVKQLTGAFILGAGQDVDMVVGRAGGLAGPSIPDMDASMSAKQIEVQGEADGFAAGVLSAHRSMSEMVSFGLRVSEHPGMVGLGATVRVWVEGDVFMLDGWREGYVVSLSGDLSGSLGVGVL